jgi:hypothetical protein
MSAVDTIEGLIRLGLKVKDAFATSRKDWETFLQSPDFRAIEADVDFLLTQLRPDDIQQAIVAIQKKKQDVRAGKDISALSSDKLLQFFDLLEAEKVLVLKQLTAANRSKQDFLTVLERDVLPTLVSVAKVIIPLLI